MKKRFKDTSEEDIVWSLIYLTIYILAIVFGAIYFLPDYWYIWIAIVVIGLFALVHWHTEFYGNRCTNPKCNHEFEISKTKNLVSPHGFNREYSWKYLKCPKCKKRVKAKIVRKF
jgi:hypothetical protein